MSAVHLLRLSGELARAGRREVGGVLVGEHLGGERFALLDFSVQRRGGGRAHFRRDPVKAAAFVEAAIARHGGDPARVNYLGEWHSHPACPAVPSPVDVAQMRDIVDDPDQPGEFSVLLVVSLTPTTLQMSMTLFRRGVEETEVTVELDGGPPIQVAFPGDGVEVRDGAQGDEEEHADA